MLSMPRLWSSRYAAFVLTGYAGLLDATLQQRLVRSSTFFMRFIRYVLAWLPGLQHEELAPVSVRQSSAAGLMGARGSSYRDPEL